MSIDSSDFSPDSLDPDDGQPDAGAAPGDRDDRLDAASAGAATEEQERTVTEEPPD